jgi:hypothetical protein
VRRLTFEENPGDPQYTNKIPVVPCPQLWVHILEKANRYPNIKRSAPEYGKDEEKLRLACSVEKDDKIRQTKQIN